MTEREWRSTLGEIVRAAVGSPEVEGYFAQRTTPARAQLMLAQLGLFVRHRRDCWAFVSGNCPEPSVKQKILGHEYEEIIRDEHSEHGHLELIIRQAKAVGMGPEGILGAGPIPTTRAVLYAWGWLARERPWQQGLAALTVTEWGNDNRLLAEFGGGHSARAARRWQQDLGLTLDDLPNFKAHAQADERHSDLFLADLARFATGPAEAAAVQTARESMELYRVFYGGIADAMAALS